MSKKKEGIVNNIHIITTSKCLIQRSAASEMYTSDL